jgi:hypothetical protein
MPRAGAQPCDWRRGASRTADVTFGAAGSNAQGTVPMHVTRRLHNPVYYAISAPLNGGGSVSCKIKVDGKTSSSAQASGSYNIVSCEISKDLLTGQWQNSNSGYGSGSYMANTTPPRSP